MTADQIRAWIAEHDVPKVIRREENTIPLSRFDVETLVAASVPASYYIEGAHKATPTQLAARAASLSKRIQRIADTKPTRAPFLRLVV